MISYTCYNNVLFCGNRLKAYNVTLQCPVKEIHHTLIYTVSITKDSSSFTAHFQSLQNAIWESFAWQHQCAFTKCRRDRFECLNIDIDLMWGNFTLFFDMPDISMAWYACLGNHQLSTHTPHVSRENTACTQSHVSLKRDRCRAKMLSNLDAACNLAARLVWNESPKRKKRPMIPQGLVLIVISHGKEVTNIKIIVTLCTFMRFKHIHRNYVKYCYFRKKRSLFPWHCFIARWSFHILEKMFLDGKDCLLCNTNDIEDEPHYPYVFNEYS